MNSKFRYTLLLGKLSQKVEQQSAGQYTHQINEVTASQSMKCINCAHYYVTTVVIIPSSVASLRHNSIFLNTDSWCNYTR